MMITIQRSVEDCERKGDVWHDYGAPYHDWAHMLQFAHKKSDNIANG